MSLYTLDDIKTANRNAGHFWFEPDSVRFFKSKSYGETVTPLPDGGALFVSSELGPNQKARTFSIRKANARGHVDTVGKFQAYGSKAYAVAVLNYLALYAEDVAANPATYDAEISENPIAAALAIVGDLEMRDVLRLTRELRGEQKQIAKRA